PVRDLKVTEDDSHFFVFFRIVTPHVEVALGAVWGRAPGPLEPRMLIGRVIDDEFRKNLQATPVRGINELAKIFEVAVFWVNAFVIGDVVAVVLQWRRIKWQQPNAGDAQIFEVVEL